MPREDYNIKERSRNITGIPRQYAVVFHNDDFTPMDFVTEVLMIIFHKDLRESTVLMLKVHHEGKAVVGTYSYDIASSKASIATNAARNQGFPLRITIEKI